MIGASCDAVRPHACRARAFLMSASLHLPMPVSLSGVMLAPFTVNGRPRRTSAARRKVPCHVEYAARAARRMAIAAGQEAVDEIVAALHRRLRPRGTGHRQHGRDRKVAPARSLPSFQSCFPPPDVALATKPPTVSPKKIPRRSRRRTRHQQEKKGRRPTAAPDVWMTRCRAAQSLIGAGAERAPRPWRPRGARGLQLPFASVSRSTNSITATGALSP